MKSTGITRKIDELGRVVIPKEIRKNLCIREGESLEIITDEDNIILKKHSQIAKYNIISSKLCNIVSEIFNVDVIITDRDKVIASSINLLNKELNNQLKYYIDNRESYISDKEISILFNEQSITGYFTIQPIIDESDSIGLVIICSKTNTNFILLNKFLIQLIIN